MSNMDSVSEETSKTRDRKSNHRGRSRSRSGSRSPIRSISPTLQLRRRRRRPDRISQFDVTPEQIQQKLAEGQGTSHSSSSSFAPAMGYNSTNLAQTRHARRVYVGGITPDVTEADLTTFFNAIIETVFRPIEGGAVVSVYINRERRFAFVEMRTIALATACMSMDGIPYLNQPLKIRRPNDYNPASIPPSNEDPVHFDLSKIGIVSTTVPDSPNRILISGIPLHLTEQNLIELLQSFGKLKGFQLMRDTISGTSKGYGFCEFMDPNVTNLAIEGLNNMQIGDRVLSVRKATSQDEKLQEQLYASGQNAPQMEQTQVPEQPVIEQPEPEEPVSTTAPTRAPTQIIQLTNMVTEQDVQDDQEFADICEDIKEECSGHGTVSDVFVPRKGPAVGNVYVCFAAIDQAISAAISLAGRTFDSRLISAEYVAPEELQLIRSSST